MIDVLNFSIIESPELLTFGKDVNNMFSDFDPATDKYALAPFVSLLSGAYIEYRNACDRELRDPYTKILEGADGIRDTAYFGFRHYIVTCSYNVAAEEVEAAKRIIRVIVRHGWGAAYFGYKKETAAITKITEEIKASFMADIQLLGATSRFDRLVAAQTGFDNLQKESNSRPPSGLQSVADTRPKLIDALRKVLTTIDNHYSVNATDPKLNAYVNTLTEIIARIMTTARANQTRNENEEEAPKA